MRDRFITKVCITVSLTLGCGDKHGGVGDGGDSGAGGHGAGSAQAGVGATPADGGAGAAAGGSGPTVSDEHARRLALGDEHGCALDTGDTIVCWGSPTIEKGQTLPPAGKFKHLRGYGSSNFAFDSANNYKAWGEVFSYGDGIGAIDVGIGSRHRCLLKADATVICAGDPGAPKRCPQRASS